MQDSWRLAMKPPVGRLAVLWRQVMHRATAHEAALVRLDGAQGRRFISVDYALPGSIARGRERVTIGFRKRAGLAGGVFGCSMLRGPHQGRVTTGPLVYATDAFASTGAAIHACHVRPRSAHGLLCVAQYIR